MATAFCPISGITYKCQYLPIHTKMPHPIFFLEQKKLLGMYAKYLQGSLCEVDNYLLFLAYLNSTEKVDWQHPCTLYPESKQTQLLIANNINQLIMVIEETNCIKTPRFKQPSFIIRKENSLLANIHLYIQAWRDNLEAFKLGTKQEKIKENIKKVEDKLQWLILNGNHPLTANKLADWADLAAGFPANKAEAWKLIIRSCYNKDKMFGTKRSAIQEVLDYCLDFILPGSIYMHSLIQCLEHGLELNKNYLGFGSFLLLDGEDIAEDELTRIKTLAPTKPPVREDYANSLEFLKAKLRYTAAGGKL